MAKSIEALLGLPALMGIVEETTNALPQEKILPEGFKKMTREVIGDTAEATLTKGQRKTSRLIQYNAPPVGAGLETIAIQPWKLMHTSEELPIDPVTMQRLRQYDSWELQNLGMEEIGRQIGLFVQKMANLESTTTLMMLMNGICYFDSNYNLLPSSSGSTYSVTMSIPATNQGQLPAGPSSANLITASWATTSTDIPLQVRNIKKFAHQYSGYEPEICLYGANIPSYIQTNSYTQDYLSRYPTMNNYLMDTGEIPNGFMGLDWVPAYKAFFEDQNGTNQAFVGDDAAVFVPKPNKNWWEMILGSMQIPKTIDQILNVDSAMSNVEIKYGKYTYAHFERKPIRLDIVAGHTFLPTIKVPAAVWQADVTP